MADATIKARLEADIAQLKSALGESNEMVKKLRQENDKLSGSFKKCQNQADSSSGSFVGLASKGAALAAGWFSISTAADALKNTISSTQATADSFDVMMAKVDGTLQHMYKTIANGDWSNLTGGLSDVINRAEQAAKALDAIGEAQSRLTYVTSKSDVRIAKAKAIISDPRATKEQKEQAVKEMAAANKELLDASEDAREKYTKAAVASFNRSAHLMQKVNLPKTFGEIIYPEAQKIIEHVDLRRNLTQKDVDRYYLYSTDRDPQFAQYEQQYNALVKEMRRFGKVVQYTKIDREGAKEAQISLARLIKNNPDLERIRLIKNNVTDEERNQFTDLYTQSNQLETRYWTNINQQNKQEKKFHASSVASTKKEAIYGEGSIGDYERQLKKLQEKLRSTTSETSRGAIRQEIRLINEKIKELNTGGESKLLRDKRLGNLDVKYTKMPSIEAPIHLKVSKESQQRLNGLKEVKAEIVYTIKTKIAKGQDISDEVAQLKDINWQIHEQEEYNRRESLLATMSGKSKIHSPYKNGSDNAIASDLSSAKTSVEAWNVLLDGMAQRHSEIIVSLGQLGDAFGGLGEAIGGNAGQWLKWLGNVTQAIGAAIPAITALTTAENLKASASGKAAAAGAASAMSFLGPIGAIAAIASVVAAITSIPKFATGGIVGGSSFYGDKILARVNSGELIANGDQQKRIWQQMEASRTTIIKQEVELGGSVTLRGQDLVIALARADRSRQR